MKRMALLLGGGLAAIISIAVFMPRSDNAHLPASIPLPSLYPSDAPFSEEENAKLILRDQPASVSAEGLIIGYLTYARYVVLNDDTNATVRGWIVEGQDSEDAYQDKNGVWEYPHRYGIGQRISFSGTLSPEISWCGATVQDFLDRAKIDTPPVNESQCFGWVEGEVGPPKTQVR